MTKLRIASDLTLPLDATTQAIGIVAKRRVGKSFTARRFAEQLLKAGQQVVIADPKGDWWGIRSSADGKAPGYPVVILGGEHGDLPLEASAGEVIAKMVVEERVSVLLDLSQFRKGEVARFMADFLETLYRLKAKEANRTPVMVIIDEADAIAPQKPNPGEERMLGAAEDIVRRGGQRGIGCMMITQRTAVLNKNVLTQCEMLIALRTISPQDLKAMQAWIDVHGSAEERDTLMASLPSLPQGDAWFWSPGWPTSNGIFKRAHVLPIETFDSGATPKSGERRVEPKSVADVDLAALQRQMAATIEKAKADDPKELRKEIAQLKKRLASTPSKERVVERTIVDERAVQRAVASAIKPYQQKEMQVQRLLARGASALRGFVDSFEAIATLGGTALNVELPEIKVTPERTPAPSPRPQAVAAYRPSKSTAAKGEPSVEGVTPSMQKILDALATFETLGVSPARRINVAFFAGYTENGHYNNMLGSLRTAGLIDYPSPSMIALTNAGRAAADAGRSPIRSLADMHALWLSKLSPSEDKLLCVLIDRYPTPITRADLAAETGYTENGHFNNMLGHLRTLGAIDYPQKGEVVATDVLFPDGLT